MAMLVRGKHLEQMSDKFSSGGIIWPRAIFSSLVFLTYSNKWQFSWTVSNMQCLTLQIKPPTSLSLKSQEPAPYVLPAASTLTSSQPFLGIISPQVCGLK